jgi:hypothetical protein
VGRTSGFKPRRTKRQFPLYMANVSLSSELLAAVLLVTAKKEIERLGLFVEVLVKTDIWYPQENTPVRANGEWTLKDARFGGSTHIIKAVLKDRHRREYESAEIEVTVSKS